MGTDEDVWNIIFKSCSPTFGFIFKLRLRLDQMLNLMVRPAVCVSVSAGWYMSGLEHRCTGGWKNCSRRPQRDCLSSGLPLNLRKDFPSGVKNFLASYMRFTKISWINFEKKKLIWKFLCASKRKQQRNQQPEKISLSCSLYIRSAPELLSNNALWIIPS